MPFQTDTTWTPTTYRRALAAWAANAHQTDSKVLPRKAKTKKPRHGDLSRQLRSLLTWRAMSNGEDWTTVAVNDNYPKAPLIDSDFEIQPSIGELLRAMETVEFEERRHARKKGQGQPNVVPIAGDIERGPVEGQKRRRAPYPDCVVRLGKATFSAGARRESALIRDAAGKIVRGSVRIPLGGLVKVGWTKARDKFIAANDNQEGLTVDANPTAGLGRMDFVDPVANAREAVHVRSAVGPETAAILDLTIRSSNFSEIGEHLGHAGKQAERKGKIAVIKACAQLDKILAA